MYPKWSALATGGALGDGLFFLASGYTLLLGRKLDFLPWYRRRVSRIYPTVIAWALLSSLIWGWQWYVWDLVTTPKYWFISSIMIYYIIFWIIRRWATAHMRWVVLLTAAIILLANFCILNREAPTMYGQQNFMSVFYFSFMLLGAIMAMKPQKEISARKAFAYAILSIVSYYGCMAILKLGQVYCQFQVLSLLPLLSSIYWLFRGFDTPWSHRILQYKGIGRAIKMGSELTLEVYLVQYAVFTEQFNNIFPLNLFLAFILIFCLAYLLKVVSRFVALLFNEQPIELAGIWKIS